MKRWAWGGHGARHVSTLHPTPSQSPSVKHHLYSAQLHTDSRPSAWRHVSLDEDACPGSTSSWQWFFPSSWPGLRSAPSLSNSQKTSVLLAVSELEPEHCEVISMGTPSDRQVSRPNRNTAMRCSWGRKWVQNVYLWDDRGVIMVRTGVGMLRTWWQHWVTAGLLGRSLRGEKWLESEGIRRKIWPTWGEHG